ncbi:MAG: HlyD family efflux transporter periplasmic adaptor subunit [Proteobacteria bacterium]|nr:HlyD family efflux transporter periplasmic adaptor subunit [Pseudomonadota bacterium]
MIDTDLTQRAATPHVGAEPTPSATRLPVPASPQPGRRVASRRGRWALGLLIAAASVLGGLYWWRQSLPDLPLGFAAGNGRVETDEIDIETKFAGRVAERFVDEGDVVRAGQALARMDTRDLEASLGRAEAQVLQARRVVDEARSNIEQQRAQAALASQQLERTAALLQQGYATRELFDQRRQQRDSAAAALVAAEARLGGATHALEAAQHDAELQRINIADNLLTAPRDGRIQYRLATVGEVLPAGGKVFTMLDSASVYMNIYLPTTEVGRAKVGADARIVVDALPDRPIPAKVSFVANQAQFTPKAVETRSERDKLMFRVKVRIDPEYLRALDDMVRAGMPGVAYVQIDPGAAWPKVLAAGTVP